MYRVRHIAEVDEHIAQEIRDMYLLTFGDVLSHSCDPEQSPTATWWLAHCQGIKEPVGYAALCPSVVMKGYAFMMRSGVLAEHRGKGLQYRMLRVREAYAKRAGIYKGCVTYTIDNPHSANNIIRAGYKTYTPPWEFAPGGIYFIKHF